MDQWLPLIKDRLTYMAIPDEHIIDEKLKYVMAETAEYIQNFISRDHIPEQVKFAFIRACVGEYLYILFTSGLLDKENFHSSLASITEGDVSYSFNKPEGLSLSVEDMIHSLRTGNLENFLCVRQLNWGF